MNKLLYCFLIFTLVSCNRGNETRFELRSVPDSTVLIKKTINANGEVLVEEQLNLDSVKNGFYLEYDNNKVKVSGNYRDNKKDGIWVYFTNEGDTVKQERWFLGKKFGAEVEYVQRTSSGFEESKIRFYHFFNTDGERIFFSKFALNGKVEKISGKPFYYIYNSDNVILGSEFDLVLFFSTPPSFYSKIKIEEIESRNNKISEKWLISDTTEGVTHLNLLSKFTLNRTFQKSGVYLLRIVYFMGSKTEEALINDTSVLKININ